MTTMPTKAFPTADVLSTITGRLMGDIGGVLSGTQLDDRGERLYAPKARPVIVAAHPELGAAIAEADQVNRDNYRDWLALWLDRYGPAIDVPRFNADQHERIDPLSELAEKVSPDRIVVIGTGGKP